MKKITLFALALFLINQLTSGQIYSKEYGVISNAEFDLTEYEKDPDAEAVVLFDLGKSSFVRSDNGFDILFERKTRIKVLKEAGVDYANIEIPLYKEGNVYEKAYDIKATIYNFENGRISREEITPDNVYEEKSNEYYVLKKFAIPNVKVGTILEYTYKINSPHIFNLWDWEFQWRIPVVHSKYEARLIPFYEYTYIMQGATSFDVMDSYEDRGMTRRFSTVDFNDMVYIFAMNDVPAFKSEEFITSINDYIIKIDFQLSVLHHLNGSEIEYLTTWEDMVKKLLKRTEFGKYVKKSGKMLAKVISEDSIAVKSEAEKFDYILDAVKGNINWNGYNRYIAKTSPSKLLDKKTGNSADINLFTVGLLNAAGIEAFPVLISTRNHGKVKHDYPFAHFFNYVIILAKVDGANILTDATEVMGLNKRIPTRCVNDKGLIVKDGDNVSWVSLECKFPSKIQSQYNLEFADDELVKVKVDKAANEYDALYYRNTFFDDKEKLTKHYTEKGYTIVDSSLAIENAKEKKKPYKFSFTAEEKPEKVGDKIYIDPFLYGGFTNNPLKQKDRTYPIDMVYSNQRIYVSKINIPDGYKIEYLPKDETINNSYFSMNYKTLTSSNSINVSFDYNFKKSVYTADDYKRIKYYYKEVIRMFEEKVVLVKN